MITAAEERVLKAFANRKRIQILDSIRKRKSMSVGSLAEEIKLSFKATSKHLAVLLNTGVLDKEQDGPLVMYSIHPSPSDLVKRLLAAL